jgi:hypothetical protein
VGVTRAVGCLVISRAIHQAVGNDIATVPDLTIRVPTNLSAGISITPLTQRKPARSDDSRELTQSSRPLEPCDGSGVVGYFLFSERCWIVVNRRSMSW